MPGEFRSYVWVLAVTLPVLAGCTESPDPGPPVEDPVDPSPPLPFDFLNATWPTGEGARKFIVDYVMTHPYRLGLADDSPFVQAARDDLEQGLKDAGLRTERHTYATGVNILGFKDGTKNPEQWVVLSAHYDTAETTVFGGWDDGAGVAMLLELAKSIGTWEFPFTLVFAFWDEEELGLLGSKAFVEEFRNDDKVDVVANLNTDPPGLNWPCGDATGPFTVQVIPSATYRSEPTARDTWLAEAVDAAINVTGVPRDVIDDRQLVPVATVFGTGLVGTSDHASFDDAELANVYLGGNPAFAAGPVETFSYAVHTPLDTLQQMELRCGGQKELEAGLGTISDIFGHTLGALASIEVPPA